VTTGEAPTKAEPDVVAIQFWSEFGKNRVTAYELVPNGYIYYRAKNVEKSLQHRDKEKAKQFADDLAAALRKETEHARDRKPKAGFVFQQYLDKKSIENSEGEQKADERCADMFLRLWGRDFDLSTLSQIHWDDFIRRRISGEIDANGCVVEKDRKPVTPTTAAGDLVRIRCFLNWAVKAKLMTSNPWKGLDLPVNPNVRRPVASAERYEKVYAEAPKVSMVVYRPDSPARVRSYLPEVLCIAAGTGRRIVAVLSLQESDLLLSLGPHGSIRWRAETDKRKKERVAPMNAEVREAVDRQLARRAEDEFMQTSPYLFPSPKDLGKPVRYELASAWLLEAERLGELEKQKGGLWHPYRRRWATERKHFPLKDVAECGGWEDIETLVKCYTAPDFQTMIEVVSSPNPLKETP